MKKEDIRTTCWKFIQGLVEKPCCSSCPGCNCHKTSIVKKENERLQNDSQTITT